MAAIRASRTPIDTTPSRPFCRTSGSPIVEPSIVRLHDVAVAFGSRQCITQALPLRREQNCRAATKPPIELLAASGGDAEQDDLGDAMWISLRIRERQRAAPRAAQHQPSIDVEMLAQPLDIRDEVGGGVAREVGIRGARRRRAAPAIALIEQHDAIGGRIEQPAMPWRASRAGTAVQHDAQAFPQGCRKSPNTPGCRRRPPTCHARMARSLDTDPS